MKNKNVISGIIVWALVLFFGLASVYAGDPARTGTAAGTQTLVPVGARYLAMGGANIATTEGVDGIYWNPAALSSMKYRAAGVFSTMTIFNDVNVNYLAVGFKMGRVGSLGFTLKTFDFGDIPLTTIQDPDGASGRTFSPTFVTTGLTYSRMVTDAIQVGITGKVVYESIPRATATAFAFDAGIQYHGLGGIEGLSMGVVVKNIGTNMKYDGSGLLVQGREKGDNLTKFLKREPIDNQLPALIELGVGYRYSIAEKSELLLAGNFQNFNFGNDSYKFGVEYTYGDLIALRGGYRIVNNLDTENVNYRFTLGVGLHYKFGATDLTLDYAFRDSQYFDGNNLFSLKIGF